MIYLVSLDMRPEVKLQSFTGFQHLTAISLYHRQVNDCSWRGYIFQSPSNESFAEVRLGRGGQEIPREACHRSIIDYLDYEPIYRRLGRQRIRCYN